MQARRGKLTVPDMINILRLHEPDGGSGTNWQPQNGFMFSADVCMHGGFGIIRDSNSAGSLVVHLDKDHPTIFVTGTASPCTSLFKPVWMDASLPDIGPAPSDEYDSHSLFWQHELLHRATIQDFQRRIATYAAERDALEREFVEGGLAIASAPAAKRAQFSAECFTKSLGMESNWYARVRQIPAKPKGAWFYNYAWNKFNEQANMPKV
jgi:secernin